MTSNFLTLLLKNFPILMVGMFLSVGVGVAGPEANSISESKLPLSIRGVITSSNPDNSVALLQDKKYGKLVAVRKGYMLYRSSKVVAIPSVKTVILKREDKWEFIGVRPMNFEPKNFIVEQ